MRHDLLRKLEQLLSCRTEGYAHALVHTVEDTSGRDAPGCFLRTGTEATDFYTRHPTQTHTPCSRGASHSEQRLNKRVDLCNDGKTASS